MIVELKNIRIGHAPNYATCSQKENFRFDEELLMGMPDEVVTQIQSSGGALPGELAQAVAQDGCPQFVDGKCKLQGMKPCTG